MIMTMTIMVPMTIKIRRVKRMTTVVMTNGMPTTGNKRPAGTGTMVHADVLVLTARAVISIHIPAPDMIESGRSGRYGP